MIRFFCARILDTLLFSSLAVIWGLSSLDGADTTDSGQKNRKKNQDEVIAGQFLKSAMPPEFTALFPIGREIKGLAIPTYNGSDKLSAVMRADTVIRVDEQFVDFFNLTVQVYNSRGVPDTTITMPEAAYDLVIGELASKTVSRIEQPRFTMTGDRMIFETNSQVSRLVGNVRLVIPDVGKLAPDLGIMSGKESGKTTQ